MGVMSTQEAYDRLNAVCDDDTKGYDDIVEAWSDVAIANGEWGGAPMLHEQLRTQMEPSWPFVGLDNSSHASMRREDDIREDADRKSVV